MLPVEELNTQDYQEILRHAKEKIKKIYPKWGFLGASDSAVTLLEMFAWLTEMQQFHAMQLGTEHTLAFLRLLGVSPRGFYPARLIAQAVSGKRRFFLRGMKGQAGHLVFEAEDTVYLEPEGLLRHSYQTPFYPFGKYPTQQNRFDIPLTQALQREEIHCLWIRVKEDYPIPRNPIDRDTFIPFVQMVPEYYDGRRFQACELLEDSTFGLLQSGVIRYQVPGRMGTWKGMYWLRLRVTGEYDTAPVILEICCNRVPMLQKDSKMMQQEISVPKTGQAYCEITLDSYLSVYGITKVFQREGETYRRIRNCMSSQDGEKRRMRIPDEAVSWGGQSAVICILSAEEEWVYNELTFSGDGTAGQKYFLPHKNVLGSECCVWVEDTQDSFVKWHAVAGFFAAGREEKCYVLREEEGVLEFGTGAQGACPTGKILVASYVLCEGSNGNIQKGQTLTVRSGKTEEILRCPAPASGGRSPEQLRDCIQRCREDTAPGDRAVTIQDFEELLLRTPGLRIRSARITPSAAQDNCLEVVFLPYTNDGRNLQGDGYSANILSYLEKRKPLGMGIRMKQTILIHILLHLEISVKQASFGVREQIEKRLRQYFDEQMNFGKTILYSHLYAFVETMPETERICELTLRARGRGAVRAPNHDILIPPEGIGHLDELHIKLVTKS